MTGLKGNSEFCFPEIPIVAEGNIQVRGEAKLTVSQSISVSQSLSVLLYLPTQNRTNYTQMSVYNFIAKCYKSQ